LVPPKEPEQPKKGFFIKRISIINYLHSLYNIIPGMDVYDVPVYKALKP